MKTIKLQISTLVILYSVPFGSLNAQANLYELRSIVSYMSDDDKAGRKNGSQQSFLVSGWIEEYFETNGLVHFNNDFLQDYSYINRDGDTIRERNVVGLLPGCGSGDYNYIILSAHFDHLGIISGEADSIYNGANDDATGVAMILSLIKELKQIQEREYNVIFVAYSGEEEGLCGSAYFATNLPVPQQKIQLNLNFEMLGRTGCINPYNYFITGLNYTNLKDVILEVNNNEKWSLDTSADNNLLFLRSDNYSLVRASLDDPVKIPAHTVSVDSDNSKSYHTPGDAAGAIDYENLLNLVGYSARLIDHIGRNRIEIRWLKEIQYEFEIESDGMKFQLKIQK
ncbi:M28 family metallopeptidase [Bacteroidota bacterium]